MAEQLSQNIVISFASVSEADTPFIKVELDDEQNNEKSEFGPGEDIFIRVFRYPANAYQVFTNGGTATKVGTNIPLNVTDEEITFARETEQSLAYRPTDGTAVTLQAACTTPPSPIVEGDRVSFATEITESFKASYQTLYDRWRLVYPCTDGPALFVAVMDEQKSSLEISISETLGPQEYDLIVRDYCTDDIVANATVFLDGVEIGSTDSSGKINLGLLNPGQTYQLKVTKTGFIDSDLDALRNDSFTVPES